MKRRHRRLTFVAVAAVLLAGAAALILTASRDALVFFKSPTELVDEPVEDGRRLRIGGLVEEGSIEHIDGAAVSFRVTDLANSVTVTYAGILPDLFREGQGVVAEGHLDGGVFLADQVLARHDETYMPPEVADALKASGHWQETSGADTGGAEAASPSTGTGR